MVSEFPARREPAAKRTSPKIKNLFLPLESENLPKVGMNAASTNSEVRGTQRTTAIGALRLKEMVGRMSDMIPVSRGGTKLPMFIAARETHLRLPIDLCKQRSSSTVLYELC